MNFSDNFFKRVEKKTKVNKDTILSLAKKIQENDMKNEKKYKGFLGWLYDFLTFKKFVIDYILRFTYVCLAIYLTLASFGLIGTSFLLFLTTLIGGNLVLRIAYEFSLMLINICVNVAEINKKMK